MPCASCGCSSTSPSMGVGGLKQTRRAGHLDGSDVWNPEGDTACSTQNRLIHLLSASCCFTSRVVFEPELIFIDDMWRNRSTCVLERWHIFVRSVPCSGGFRDRLLRGRSSMLSQGGSNGGFIGVVNATDSVDFQHLLVTVQGLQGQKRLLRKGAHDMTMHQRALFVEGEGFADHGRFPDSGYGNTDIGRVQKRSADGPAWGRPWHHARSSANPPSLHRGREAHEAFCAAMPCTLRTPCWQGIRWRRCSRP